MPAFSSSAIIAEPSMWSRTVLTGSGSSAAAGPAAINTPAATASPSQRLRARTIAHPPIPSGFVGTYERRVRAVKQ